MAATCGPARDRRPSREILEEHYQRRWGKSNYLTSTGETDSEIAP